MVSQYKPMPSAFPLSTSYSCPEDAGKVERYGGMAWSLTSAHGCLQQDTEQDLSLNGLEVLCHAHMGIPSCVDTYPRCVCYAVPSRLCEPCSALSVHPCDQVFDTTMTSKQTQYEQKRSETKPKRLAQTAVAATTVAALRPSAAMSTREVFRTYMAQRSTSCAAQPRPRHHVAFIRHAYRRCSYRPVRGLVRCLVSSPRYTLVLPTSAKVYLVFSCCLCSFQVIKWT